MTVRELGLSTCMEERRKEEEEDMTFKLIAPHLTWREILTFNYLGR